jgi:hypothetical protein
MIVQLEAVTAKENKINPLIIILTMSQISENQKAVNKLSKFGFTVRNKAFQNKKLITAIDDYLLGFNIELPNNKADYERLRAIIYDYDSYGDGLECKLEEIVKLRYAIGNTKGYYAMFSQGNQKILQPMAFWYSKHRFCSVWNWRKSQIIRSKYRDFLMDATDSEGNKLINHYLPIHLVLTAPHKEGIYQGKRFYAKELIEAFTAMRKTEIWKKYVYAGEYGLEVKKSEQHGLHIHIHSFLLQNPKYSIVEAAKEITELWKFYIGNDTTYSGLHYEGLYTHERDEKGRKIMQQKEVYDKKLRAKVIKEVPVKKYIDPNNSHIDDYLSGVLECIKYHFKPDCIQTDEGRYDMELIEEILNNTKNKRLYSRFGNFYNVKELNFNNLEKEEETDTIEDDLTTTTDGVEERVINPITLEKVTKRTDYEIVIGNPLSIKYREKTTRKPLENYVYNVNGLRISDQCLTLKQVIRLDMIGLPITGYGQEVVNKIDFEKHLLANTKKDKIREQAKEILRTYQDFPEIDNYEKIKDFEKHNAVFGDVVKVNF